ncbi:hypothetical protein NDU88_005965 [Pleurodeles waltl]|uniref:Uncharacterized protein n=1 Tax=Pleurodeles waltl TaxID=8319 RepID=A0AAV7VQ29_PLEWA|nr:hypothetical protein NDU88_005965 [Pleurodeles waltl]
MTHSPTGRYLWGTEGSTTSGHMPIHPDVLNGDRDTKEMASGEEGDGEAVTGAEDRCEEEMQKEPPQPSKAMDNEVRVVRMAQMMEKIDLGKRVRKGVAVWETHQTGRGEDEGSRHVPGETWLSQVQDRLCSQVRGSTTQGGEAGTWRVKRDGKGPQGII